MRLEALEAIPYSLPFREPYVTSRGELTERRLILLRIRADGIEGLGETTALSLRGGPDLAEIARQLTELCRPALEEGPIDPKRLWSALARCRNRGVSSEALAAVDIALHDLVAKATEMPVWKLLGAERAELVPCNATLPAANPTRLRTLANGWAAEGFGTFKLKVGLPGDVTQVATIREALGPGGPDQSGRERGLDGRGGERAPPGDGQAFDRDRRAAGRRPGRDGSASLTHPDSARGRRERRQRPRRPRGGRARCL